MDLNDKELLSTFEVARIVGVHHQTVNSWVRKGWLSAARTPGGHRRIKREELANFLRRHQHRTEPLPTTEATPKHILIVEDEAEIREVMVESIRQAFPAIDISFAIDGYDAGRKMSRIVPTLVFLDLMMPGIDGFHVLRDIRSDSRLRGCRVVVVTGHHTRRNGEEALKAGADLVLTKPVPLDVIHRVVRHIVVEEQPPGTLKIPLENVAPFFEG